MTSSKDGKSVLIASKEPDEERFQSSLEILPDVASPSISSSSSLEQGSSGRFANFASRRPGIIVGVFGTITIVWLLGLAVLTLSLISKHLH